ncbi:MAG: Holliday junction branch migration protein RuvA [Rhodospirillales bacterium]
MIGSLRGMVEQASEDFALIDVAGVGYLVFASARTLRGLPPVGSEVRLQIETHVREDHIHLYGFLDAAERDWFRLLLTVQGVGARVALALLSALSPAELATAIAAQDRTAITRAQGVGPKLGQRLVTELKEKAAAMVMPAALAKRQPGEAATPASVNEDAVSALVNLGYKRVEAYGAVARAMQGLGDKPDVQALIRAGLRELSQ